MSALGIEADKVDEIIAAHTEVTDALKQERDRYKADAEALPAAQKELDELRKAAEASGKDPYRVKYEALKEDFDSYKKQVTEKETTAKKTAAYRELLIKAGIPEKRVDAVLRVSDLSKVTLDKDGAIEGADALTTSVKTEWADFIPTAGSQGAPTPKPPANNGGTKMTKEQIYAIKDTAARQQAIADNHELFGF